MSDRDQLRTALDALADDPAEPIICCTRGGRLPWSDNTAMGHMPKYKPGGKLSHRKKDAAGAGRGRCQPACGDVALGVNDDPRIHPGVISDTRGSKRAGAWLRSPRRSPHGRRGYSGPAG
jgi:hypothetical protein